MNNFIELFTVINDLNKFIECNKFIKASNGNKNRVIKKIDIII